MAAKALIGLYAACKIAQVGLVDSISLIDTLKKHPLEKLLSFCTHKENMLEYCSTFAHTKNVARKYAQNFTHTSLTLTQHGQHKTCSTPCICTHICMHLCTDSSARADLALPNQEARGQTHTHTHGKTCGMDVRASHTCSNTDILNCAPHTARLL